MERPKYLIKDTTREERMEIVRRSFGTEDSCESGVADPFKMYQAYVDGEKEIAEINLAYRAHYTHG